jgi:pyridoxal 5'-phosphate synthase pdxS subunit
LILKNKTQSIYFSKYKFTHFMFNTKGIQLADMLKGGVIMDVSNVEQAKIAQEAGACAVMALERIPSQIRKDGGVARSSDPKMIREIQEAVSIPVMAKARIGHFVEAQILEALNVDFIDESEVLTPADEQYHIDKTAFQIPFVCGCRNLGEALRRIEEGASMIRTKGEAGTGNIVEAVRHQRQVQHDIKQTIGMNRAEIVTYAKTLGVSVELLLEVQKLGRLPVPSFSAGGIATPADAALMMALGSDGVFVGSGIFGAKDPLSMAKAIVKATTFWNDPKMVMEASYGIGEAMPGLEIKTLEVKMAGRDE